jgi:ABC-type multidrug transport system fused ATPase/permease subunit
VAPIRRRILSVLRAVYRAPEVNPRASRRLASVAMSSDAVLKVFPAVRTAFFLLPGARRRRFLLVVVGQVFVSILDLVGVLLVAAVGALAVEVIQGGNSVPSALQLVVNPLVALGLDIRQVTLTLTVAAAIFLVIKSLLSGLLSRSILIFLAARQAELSGSLLSRFLNQPVVAVQSRSSQRTAYGIVQGATNAVVGILGSAAIVVSETALLIIFGIALLWINPLVTMAAFAFLVLIGLSSYRLIGNWSARVGAVTAQTVVRGNTGVHDAISTFREVTVLGRTGLYVKRIRRHINLGARAQADGAFIVQIPKLVFESSLTLGAVILAGLLFLTSDAETAVGTLVLFLAAGSRVMPSIMRLQGAIVGIRASAGSAVATFVLASELGDVSEGTPDLRTNDALSRQLDDVRDDFSATISFESVTFFYPGSDTPALNSISLDAEAGSSLALVGSTGAGKSTFADALLGVIDPTSGRVLIGGLQPALAIARWPGGIAYVPQHVALVEGSVRENVALGLPPEIVDDSMVWEALASARLAEFLREHRDGLDTLIGERGVRLSGGQRQRLGLARAMFTRPQLLVLDEATSALDAQTESLIVEVISSLHGRTTVVVVAHRLATVRQFDQVAYLDNGDLIFKGTFDEVRRNVPAFDAQARILGLH